MCSPFWCLIPNFWQAAETTFETISRMNMANYARNDTTGSFGEYFDFASQKLHNYLKKW